MTREITAVDLSSYGLEEPERRGPTPVYELLTREVAELGKGLTAKSGWSCAVHPDGWRAEAYVGLIEVAFAIRGDMDTAMRALLGELYAMDEI